MASDSAYLFNYIDDMWSMMSEEDQQIFANTWKSYEMTYGDVWMQLLDRQMATNIDYLPLYNVRRWQKYIFNDSTKVNLSATYTSPQDLSLGIDLSARYLIRLQYDASSIIEIDLRGVDASSTKISEIVSKINALTGDTIAFAIQNKQLLQFKSPTSGPTSSLTFHPATDSSKDASEIILGFDPLTDLPKTFPQFPYSYNLGDTTIVSIPELQDKVKEENITIQKAQDVDFSITFGSGLISFATIPPEIMWAPDTLINLETPYNNFGYLLGIYDTNTEAYLKAVKGLWYAFWTGPRPENIKRSLYLLFGLPTASGPGIVTSVTPTTISLLYDDGGTEDFAIPSDLSNIVFPNQRVDRFQPLVSGIRVLDKINYPGFVEREVGRYGIQPFLTENASRGLDPNTDESKALRMLEENTYLPQIDVATFISNNIKLGNVKTFLSTLQPKSRTYLFQILVGNFGETVSIKDEGNSPQTSVNFPNGNPALAFDVTFDATPNVDYNPNTFASQTDLDDAENNEYTWMQLDEGHAMGDVAEIDVYNGVTLIDSFSLEG